MMRLLTAVFAAEVAATPWSVARGQAPAEPVASIEFELHRNKILVPVHLAGQGPFSFVLDTGSPVTVLGSSTHASTLSLRRERSVRVGGAGAGEAPPAYVTQAVDVALGGLSLGTDRLIVLDIADQMAASSGKYYDGVIGKLLFDRYIVRIDFERRILELYEPDDYRVPNDANVMPIRMENGHPHVDTRITMANGDEVDVDLVIDIGARTALALDGDRRSRLAPPDDAIEMIVGHGAGGLVRGRVARVAAVALGDTTIRDVLTAFVDDALGMSPGADGNLGNEVLRRFAVTIDYPGQRLVLEPGPNLGDPFPVDLSGITLRAEGDTWSKLSVADVRPGSPAFTAGVRVGDVITGVDGSVPQALQDLERRLAQPGTIQLELLRGGTPLSAAMVLPHVSS